MNTSLPRPGDPIVGRGPSINPPNRFERLHLEADPDAPPEEQPHPRTQFFYDATETILHGRLEPDYPRKRPFVEKEVEETRDGYRCTEVGFRVLQGSQLDGS